MSEFAQMIAELKVQVNHPATNEALREKAIELAYQIGHTQGHHEGKIEGLEQMHASQKAIITDVFNKVSPC